jgi:uncharacterized protein YndB with AHSA1/START domain
MNDLGTITEQGTVRLERLLPGPIERVWAYLTESEKRKTWFASGVFDLRVGGKADLHFDHDNISSEPRPADRPRGKKSDYPETITRLEPPRLLAYTFGVSGPDSEVTFELTPRGKDVLLVVTHTRIASRDAAVTFASGWDVHLGILADRLNGVEPRPFWSTHAKVQREYQTKA